MERVPLALVTGANGGLGLRTATELASLHGYHVLIAGRNMPACEEAASRIREQGHRATALHIDLEDDNTIYAAEARLRDEFDGQLNVLVNNAAVALDIQHSSPHSAEDARGHGKELDDKDLKSVTDSRTMYTRTFATNVIGTALLTELCAPFLKRASSASQPSRVVFVSSIKGSMVEGIKITPSHLSKAYSSSKAALNRMAIDFAAELREGQVLVNICCPGYIATKMTKFDPSAGTMEDGVRIIVKLALLGKGGPTGTYSDRNGTIPW